LYAAHGGTQRAEPGRGHHGPSHLAPASRRKPQLAPAHHHLAGPGCIWGPCAGNRHRDRNGRGAHLSSGLAGQARRTSRLPMSTLTPSVSREDALGAWSAGLASWAFVVVFLYCWISINPFEDLANPPRGV